MDNAKFIYSRFIKYDILESLISQPIINSLRSGKIKLINVYIDVRSIFKYVLSNELIDPKVMSVSILNAAAHYRHYFRKRFNKNVRVFLVDSQDGTVGSLFTVVNNNNMAYSDKFIDTVCRYFPDVFYIKKDNFNASSVILSTMKKYGGNPFEVVSIVLSNDIYSYQFPIFNQNTYTLKIGQTKTKLITSFNAIYEWSSSKSQISDLNQGLLPLVMALNKCPELNMTCIANFKTAISKIRSMIASNVILNGHNTPNSILVQKGYITDLEYNRWRLTDLNTQADVYHHSMVSMDDTWLIKKTCDMAMFASMIDRSINSNPDTILNYVYLIE